MRVLNYLELERHLQRSGIGTAVRHQRTALAGTDVDVVTSPWRGGRPSAALRRRFLGDAAFESVDVAHCNLVGPGSLAVARHARRNDVPLVLHAHTVGDDFAESFRGSTTLAPAFGRYLRWFYSRADLVLCPSGDARRRLQALGVEAPIRQVTNGVDIDALAGHEDLRDDYRERYALDGTVVFAVGNVFERKGLSDFCRLAERTDYEFAWFGPYDTGPLASRTVRRWVRDPPSNVTFTGWVDDVRGAYAAGDVFCFPTKNETQGVAVLEAMACGKAVVLRDIPVFEEFYTHGEDCLKCGTLPEFASAIERLATDPGLCDRLGAGARETARGHDLDRVADRLRDAYATALGSSTAGDDPSAGDAESTIG